MQVLVIDDNAVNRRYVKSVIEEGDIRVFEACDGKEGIELAKSQKPDLILVDIQMPNMDGFECLNRLKQIAYLHSPIIAITAFSNPEDRNAFIEQGFQDYLNKPVKPNVLLNTVNYWLKRKADHSIFDTNTCTPEFDPKVKNDLLNYLEPSGLAELYQQFEEEVNGFLKELTTLNSSKNYYNICSILHTIKGNAGSLGFFELSALADCLEKKIKLGDYDFLEQELLDLKAYAQQLFIKYETQFNLNL